MPVYSVYPVSRTPGRRFPLGKGPPLEVKWPPFLVIAKLTGSLTAVTADVVMHSDFHVEEIFSIKCRKENVEKINRMSKRKCRHKSIEC